MEINLNAIGFRNGVPYNTTLNLVKRADGSWHAKNFDDILKDQYDASKSAASQPQDCDTYETDASAKTKLSDQEIAEFARKYNLRNMTQDQYDTFLEDLVEKGALTRFDSMRLGYKGWRILDISPDAFISGVGCGSCYATAADGSDNELLQSLEDADGDLVRWLESLLAQQSQGTVFEENGYQNTETIKTLLDIIKRMQAI